MTKRVTTAQLEKYLWGAADLLRGSIDAGEYKSYIFPLLFLKRLSDVYDEETNRALVESSANFLMRYSYATPISSSGTVSSERVSIEK